jgi:hypothetical protein
MLTTDPQVCDETAEVYGMTEGARLRLRVDDPELGEIRRAVGEAAYYLSDTFGPHERQLLLRQAEAEAASALSDEARAATPVEALVLLCDARSNVERILSRGRASSELRIALRALRRAIEDLAGHLGVATGPLDPGKPAGRRFDALRRDRSKG